MTFLRAFVGEFQVRGREWRRRERLRLSLAHANTNTLSSSTQHIATQQGKFEEVLALAEEFKGFCEKMKGHIQELDEFECHRCVCVVCACVCASSPSLNLSSNLFSQVPGDEGHDQDRARAAG